jgi:DNA-directed RNA polymerase beta subunit
MDEELKWKIIDKFFKDNPNVLVSHHLDSYNDFFNKGIKRIFKEKNPIKIMKKSDNLEKDSKEFDLQCHLYLGGKNGDKLYFGKPIIYDEHREHFMYPNEARLRNMTYGTTIHYDVDVEFFIKEGEEVKTITETIPMVYLGKFPIMLNSDLCILKNLDAQVKFNMGECKNDPGGYFIIDGKEKVVVCQEKFADNMLYVRDKLNDLYSHSAEIRSVSEDASKPMRTVSVRMASPSPKYKNGQIVVNIPNVKSPIPLFIVMRALGIESDKDIIKHCLLDIEKYEDYVDLFIPSIHDAGKIFNQVTAIKYISTFIKNPSIPGTLHILTDYFLPHIGELNFKMKAYFLGYMTSELLKVYTKAKKPTDRDSFKFKRVELTGTLIYDLFKEYYNLQQKHIFQTIDKEYYFKESMYQRNFISLIMNNHTEFFKNRLVEDGFRRGFKGNWGSEAHTKKLGVVQPLNRLSYNSFIAHLRKISLPLDASAKVVGPRLLHSSQWGIIDPIDTPDGGNVGLHKHMAISAKITSGFSGVPIIKWLRNYGNMLLLEECTPLLLSKMTKVFVNGLWVGAVDVPDMLYKLMKLARRNALIPIYTSIGWNIEQNEINIFTDAGRLCRPIFYVNENNGNLSYNREEIYEKLSNDKFTWEELISGFSKKKDNDFKAENCKLYNTVSDLYETTSLDELTASQSIIEYIDTSESESALIALDEDVIIGMDEEDFTGKSSSKSSKSSRASKLSKMSKSASSYSSTSSSYLTSNTSNSTNASSSSSSDETPSSSSDTQSGGAKTKKSNESSVSTVVSNTVNIKQTNATLYTHMEIHPSLILGVLGNQVVFPENNQLPRDLFACGQSKQAISLYHSNYQNRIDKMGVVLNYGQVPLVKSRYMKYINNEEHPYGENLIVAIGVYNGYNVEDSILFNEASVKRGMFRTTYYGMYEAREENSSSKNISSDKSFANIQNKHAIGLKPGCDYSFLDENGLIKENTELDDKKVVIGMVTKDTSRPNTFIDASELPKKGQLGFVDKAFMTEGEEGYRIAKIRVREERFPSIGDKFCSRCGQKGTVGLIIPEKDMPFTADGIRPDIIINPHAIPSRMTIGQLVETVIGKTGAIYGGFGDCTAFVNKGPKHKQFGYLLQNAGFHSKGNQILYNGFTGEQLQNELFIGPTYYMRLKHMVKDKINYRAQGPRTVLTRQTVQGRANDGGLRIGEMERDAIISHGASKFLEESLMVRGDEYYMAICNQSGSIAVYNENLNLFLSPQADGPIQFANVTEFGADVVNVSKYGREFSIVRVPYAFKLLMQELTTMNIQMRIITEDNIDQLTSMTYSDNYKKLNGNVEEELNSIIGRANQKLKTIGENRRVKEIIKPKQVNFKANDINAIRMLGWILSKSQFDDDGQRYLSIIYDNQNVSSEIWNTKEHNNKHPNRYPDKWIATDLFYDDNSPIDPTEVIETLLQYPVKNNWSIAIETIKNKKRISQSSSSDEYSPPYNPLGDNREQSVSPPYNPLGSPRTPSNSPPYNPLGSPQTPSNSPPYNPLGSPRTPSNSPPYNPLGSPRTPSNSPPYNPLGSPRTPSNSPPYNPLGSPHTPSDSPPFLLTSQKGGENDDNATETPNSLNVNNIIENQLTESVITIKTEKEPENVVINTVLRGGNDLPTLKGLPEISILTDITDNVTINDNSSESNNNESSYSSSGIEGKVIKI